MTHIYCNLGCSTLIYYAASIHNSGGFTICSNCRNNGKFANHVKSAYTLFDESTRQTLLKEKQELKAAKEACEVKINQWYFYKYFEKGEGLSNFLTQKLAEYMNQYNNFVSNIKKHQSCLKGYITKSIRRITKAVEKAVMGIISDEAETLSSNIQTQNKDNEQRIKSSEKSREEIKKKLINEKIQTSHTDFDEERKEENPEITEHIYEKEEVEQFVKLLNANVERYKQKATVLFKLKAEGEKIAGELSRENKDLDITLNTTIASENEVLKLQIKE